jgi:Uma2 family endonuclease
MTYPQPTHPFSLEEYFSLDSNGETKYEYANGIVYDMAGTTANHNSIALNCAFAVRLQIGGKKCKVFMESLRLEAVSKKSYYYPDVMLTCHPLDLQGKLSIRNPSLIVTQ